MLKIDNKRDKSSKERLAEVLAFKLVLWKDGNKRLRKANNTDT